MTKRDRIVAELKRMIRDGELPRGSRIQQDVLAEQFDTSITPVREAMVLLEAEGLLVSSPNRGVSVANANIEQVKGVYLQRMLVEPYAMQRATRRIAHRDIDVAGKLLDRIEKYNSEVESVPLSQLNRQFHFIFYSNCGSEALTQHVEALWQRWPWDLLEVIKKRPQTSSDEHRAMLYAVRSGDVDQVADATREHLRQSYLSLTRHITGAQTEDPFLLDVD